MEVFIETVYALKQMIFTVAFFASLVLSIYFVTNARSKERLFRLEKGLELPKPLNLNLLVLKFAFVAIGTAVGILVGYGIFILFGLPEPVSYMSMILLFGGIALIVQHMVFRKNAND